MPRTRRPHRSNAAVAAVALLLAVAVTGCDAGTPDLDVGPAQAATPVAGSSQIVLAVTNRGDGDDALVEATTEAALGVEVHETVIEDGRASMQPRDDIPLPAGETVRFRPGGLHLMVVVPDSTVTEGGTFDLTLQFERSEPVTVPVEVVDLLDLAEAAFDEDEAGAAPAPDSP